MPKDFTTPNPALALGTTHQGFTVIATEAVTEIGGTAYILRHDASGARLMWLACADTNRSFAIAFKTPPANHTGVFHILEHSVLCGSERFPVKEPFVTLLKTSMQTFLNALTFPDKTMFPVASTNVADLENLMDVYLDAVLHPAIYERPRIFEQEGWHLELADDQLIYNGVVYNEMRGALSDPEDVLFNELQAQLFPDTCYRWISGGDPNHIPELSYEDFVDTHARHYNLPNSYTILYGDLDIERELAFIGERFAATAERGAGAPNALGRQAPVRPGTFRREMATAPENACVGLSYVISDTPSRLLVFAADILSDILAGSNEAPLKRRVLEEGLGDDLYAQVVDGELQPQLMFMLRGAREGVAERFRELVEELCRGLATDGLPHDRLEASLAQMEFTLREGDWGGYPDGIALSMQVMSSWLYDDEKPLDFVHYEDELSQLKAGIAEGLFEELLAKFVCDSTHSALVDLVAADADDGAEQRAELARRRAEMSEGDLAAIEREVTALRAEQESPDSPEALATLPRLSLADVDEACAEASLAHDAGHGIPTLVHDLDTHGILYAYYYFDLAHLSFEEYRYLPLLGELLGQIDTSKHTALELDTLIQANLGRLNIFPENFHPDKDSDDVRPKLVVGASVLADKVEMLPRIVGEVCTGTLFENADRMRDLFTQRRISLEQGFINAGHTAALSRVASYYSRSALATQQLIGIDHYQFLKDILASWNERASEVCATLSSLCRRIFCKGALTVSLTGPAWARERFWEAGGAAWLGEDFGTTLEPRFAVPEPVIKNEAICTPANVCFVAMGSGLCEGDDPTADGSWQVASRALTLDYLWNEVRVKGGAYGCGFRRFTTGQRVFWSYRDPNTAPTVARFEGAASWLASWEPSETELEGYIVSSVSGHDAPVKPRALARRQDSAFFSDRDNEWRERLRREMLTTTAEKLRALAPSLADAAQNHAICVFGSRDLIEQGKLELTAIDLM